MEESQREIQLELKMQKEEMMQPVQMEVHELRRGFEEEIKQAESKIEASESKI